MMKTMRRIGLVVGSMLPFVGAKALAAAGPADPTMTELALNVEPGKEYAFDVLDYAMVLGLERTVSGRLWAAWVAGGDNEDAFAVLSTSDDDGVTWSAARLVIDPPEALHQVKQRTLVGNLWSDPTGRLWFFFDRSLGYFDGRAGVWATVCEDPDADRPTWSKPTRIWHGSTLNKPIVLSNGDWLLPVSLWPRRHIRPTVNRKDAKGIEGLDGFEKRFRELDDLRMAHVFVSSDRGKTWSRRGGVEIPDSQFDEHMLVELKDGRIWLLARTVAGPLAESFSSDRGATWSRPRLSRIAHVSSRFHIRRLQSGVLLMVKHGYIDENPGRRTRLMAFLSPDDGKTWKGGLMLDERSGVSYPDAIQSKDGSIYVLYDRNRATDSEILMAKFTEEDVMAKKIVHPQSRLKMMVHKALGPKRTR